MVHSDRERWQQEYEASMAIRKQREHILLTHGKRRDKTGSETKLQTSEYPHPNVFFLHQGPTS